jgi:N-hydroxyarylamine O-acetyltransferase
MNLDAYLQRIGLAGPLSPTLKTLQAVHRAQALTVPYEAVDVFAGHTVSADLAAIQDKIIRRGRGGWCYEQNGLLIWALATIGFDVRRAVAGAYHGSPGPEIMGNHVVGLVTLQDTTWLCDLGLGDALRGPIPLIEGEHRDGPLLFRLERLQDGRWRFWNHAAGDPSNFDLDPSPADETLIQRKHDALLADPNCSFRLNFQAMRMAETSSTVIYGRVLRRTSPTRTDKRLIEGVMEMEALLETEFNLKNIAVSPLWHRILARHAQVFGAADAIP